MCKAVKIWDGESIFDRKLSFNGLKCKHDSKIRQLRNSTIRTTFVFSCHVLSDQSVRFGGECAEFASEAALLAQMASHVHPQILCHCHFADSAESLQRPIFWRLF